MTLGTKRRISPTHGWAGEYNQRVGVYRNPSDRSANTDGQRPEDETKFIDRWAAVWPVGGRERFLAQQVQADVTHRVRMRSDNQTRQITSAYWLLLSDGTRLNIKRVYDVDLRKVEIEMECNERI